MTTLISVCDGSYINDEGKVYTTHRLLLKTENKKGVGYTLEKYDAKALTTDDLAAVVGFSVNPMYDKYGRIVSL